MRTKEQKQLADKEYRKRTKAHRLQYQSEWRTPEKHREHHLRHTFNLSLEEYNILLETQNYVCKICEQPEVREFKGKVRNLAVDHDHITGRIRGLLCGACNTALGLFKEDTKILQRAKEYLND